MMAQWLNRLWYGRGCLRFLLWPLSWLFAVVIYWRRFAYRAGLLTVKQYPIPIIIVGNITVGGCGKTPLVIYLVNYLQQQGYRPAIVSRGYGGQARTEPLLVTPQHIPQQVGDEAVMIKQHCVAPLVIASKKTKAVETLLARTDCNVIVCDDGLQHYALARDVEIAVIDGVRRFGNGLCLPAGPLREPVSRLQHVDMVVSQGQAQSGEYLLRLIPGSLVNINKPQQQMTVECLHGKPFQAVAGIGHPQRFFHTLRDLGCQFSEHVFPDHHPFKASDFSDMADGLIVMTEKDAVKCRDFADERFWYLPVVVQLDEAFVSAVLDRLTHQHSFSPALPLRPLTPR